MKKIVREALPYVVIIVVILLVKAYIFTPVIVNGPSMMNTLHNKDVMILDKIGMRLKEIDRFDIVVIKTNHNKIIKRVIGLPGEIIEYKDNQLYINGSKVEEPYGTGITYDFEEVQIPEDSYYVLGDNRQDSVDSRVLGTIPKQDILGHATFIIYPFNRFGKR